MKTFFGILTIAACLAPIAAQAADAGTEKALAAAVAAPTRKPTDTARDAYRHPVETLAFFDVRPDMSVAEIFPGGGWYTDILAPYLKAKGHYTAIYLNTPDERDQKGLTDAKAKFADKALYGQVTVEDLKPGDAADTIAPDNSLDRVLTFRNLHNWADGYHNGGKPYTGQALRAFFKALKPGGMLGIVDHRLDGKAGNQKVDDAGYVLTDYAIQMAREAGFELVAQSEINANPKDTKAHEKGVWTLPPVLVKQRTLQGEELAKYLADMRAVGESDRFTLLFRKPEK